MLHLLHKQGSKDYIIQTIAKAKFFRNVLIERLLYKIELSRKQTIAWLPQAQRDYNIYDAYQATCALRLISTL